MRESYEPIFVEGDDYSLNEYEYLYQDLPVEFQRALKENRKITAKDLKKMLKRLFPNTKFNVRTDRYAGGSSVDIRYKDGPALEKVEDVVDWDTQGFNGMYDISYVKEHKVLMPDMTIRKLEFDWYGYVSIHRSYSRKAIEKVVKEIEKEYGRIGIYEIGGNEDDAWAFVPSHIDNFHYFRNILYEKLSKTDF